MAAGEAGETEVTGAEGYTPRVLIANINRGQISAGMMMGVIDAMTNGYVRWVVLAESGPYLDSGRNMAVANAMQQEEWDWLLFVDSDIEFKGSHVRQLLAPYTSGWLDPRLHPVMGGIYVNPFADGGVPGEDPAEDRVGPVAYEWVQRDDLHGELAGVPTWTFRRLSRKSLAALDGRGIGAEDVCEVACVGTGFLALHRSLLDHMREVYPEPLPWFDEPVRDAVHYGEDMGFCLRVRDLGYPVLVNRACTPLHHKTLKLI